MAVRALKPVATIAAGAWAPTGAGTLHEAVDDTIDAPDEDATYAQVTSLLWDSFVLSFEPMVDAVSIGSVLLAVRYSNPGAIGVDCEIDIGLRIAGVEYFNGPVPVLFAAYQNVLKLWALNPATLAPWTKPQVDALQVVVRAQDPSKPASPVRVTVVSPLVDYEPVPVLPEAREQATAYLMARRRPRETPEIVMKPTILDRDLFEDFSLVHPEIPNAQGVGASLDTWRRSLQQITSFRIQPAAMTVAVKSRARHGYLYTYLDGGESRRSSSPIEDGVYRLGSGGATTYERASNAWVRDPGSGLYAQIGVNARPIARDGLLLENFASNGLKYSSARDGASSIGLGKVVVTGAGDNGCAFTAETSPPSPMFDTSASAYAYRFLAGNTHSTDLRATWPATSSYPANTKLRVWFEYLNGGTGSASRLQWRLTRAVDGFYWNDTPGAWQVGAVANVATLSSVRAPMKSKRIDTGSSSTTLALEIFAPAGGTNGRADWVYHVQSEGNYWATSPVVTDASTYAREIQRHRVANNTGKRSLNNARFTALLDVQPVWDAADMNAYGGFPLVWSAVHDASNHWKAFYNGVVGGRLDFEARVAGVTYLTTVPWSPVAGTTYRLGFLATSVDGELGLPARTFVAFVDGVPGVASTRAGDPTEAGTCDLYIGTDSVGNALNAHVRRIWFVPEVYSFEEIARGGV